MKEQKSMLNNTLRGLVVSGLLAAPTISDSLEHRVSGNARQAVTEQQATSTNSFTWTDPYPFVHTVYKSLMFGVQAQFKARLQGVDTQGRAGPWGDWTNTFPWQEGQVDPPYYLARLSFCHPGDGSPVYRYRVEFQVRDPDTGEWNNLSIEMPLYNPDTAHPDALPFGLQEAVYSGFDGAQYPAPCDTARVFIPYTGSFVPDVPPEEMPQYSGSDTRLPIRPHNPVGGVSGGGSSSGDGKNALEELLAYPNPFNGGVSVPLPPFKNAAQLRFEVLTVKGERVYESVIGPGTQEIVWRPDPSTPSGTYLMRVITENDEVLFGAKSSYVK